MLNIETSLQQRYKIDVCNKEKLSVGAGSDTYYIQAKQGNYILKKPGISSINNPEIEPRLCEYLLEHKIPVSEFVKNRDGKYLTYLDEECYHLQKYIAGKNYELNSAPQWLMKDMAAMLGKIHVTLKKYPRLPEGIGKGFFETMTPTRVIQSYQNSIKIARKKKMEDIEEDLNYRIELLEHFPYPTIEIDQLSCGNTHGDYFISQIIAGEKEIRGVIDWTTACVHPYVWEIIRSFVYGAPSCVDGKINMRELTAYLDEYLMYHTLPRQDIYMMPILFYYQIAVCDYYGQYFASEADNRGIYLHQAVFSTKLIRWFEKNIEELINHLQKHYEEK